MLKSFADLWADNSLNAFVGFSRKMFSLKAESEDWSWLNFDDSLDDIFFNDSLKNGGSKSSLRPQLLNS